MSVSFRCSRLSHLDGPATAGSADAHGATHALDLDIAEQIMRRVHLVAAVDCALYHVNLTCQSCTLHDANKATKESHDNDDRDLGQQWRKKKEPASKAGQKPTFGGGTIVSRNGMMGGDTVSLTPGQKRSRRSVRHRSICTSPAATRINSPESCWDKRLRERLCVCACVCVCCVSVCVCAVRVCVCACAVCAHGCQS
jgi:hypothetical protein